MGLYESHKSRPVTDRDAMALACGSVTTNNHNPTTQTMGEYPTQGGGQPTVQCRSWPHNDSDTWTCPQRIAPGNDLIIPLINRFCSSYVYPCNGVSSYQDCECWELARIRKEYGRGAQQHVVDCALIARNSAEIHTKGTPGTPCYKFARNALQHCLYSACLRKYIRDDRADDILMAHECCSVNWSQNSANDVLEDLNANRMGQGCSKMKMYLSCCLDGVRTSLKRVRCDTRVVVE